MTQASLMPREMIRVSSAAATLRVMQWNMLADQLATDFPRVSPEHLQWTWREALIHAELQRADADILVLEEVDHFEDSIEPMMRARGFGGIFQKKQGWHRDGTAVFYRKEKVEVSSSQAVTFEGQTQFFLLLHCCLKPATPFVLAGTHLKAKSDFEETRLAEVRQLLGALEQYRDIPVLLMGDFNSTPSRSVYAEVQMSPLGLRSAYFGALKEDAEPDFTSYKYREKLFSYTIDYVWTSRCVCTAVLSLPPPQELEPTGLPSGTYPSDHFALVCDFLL